MRLAPSASKTSILLACQYPFRADVDVPEDPPGEAAERGTLIHGWQDAYMRGKPVVVSEADDWLWNALRHWLDGVKAKVPVVWSEMALVYDASAGAVREPKPEQPGARAYGELAPLEIAGTNDLLWRNGVVTVVDLKTGDPANVEPIESNAQLRTLGLMAARFYKVDHVKVGLALLAPDGVTESWAELDSWELDAHAEALRVALEAVPTSQPTPGAQCRWCPLRTQCPAIATAIVAAPSMAIDSPEDVARAWPLLKPAEDMIAAIKAKAKALVEANGEVPLLNGKRLRLVETNGSERVSVASVKQAMGDDVVQQLRAAGAITRSAPFTSIREVK